MCDLCGKVSGLYSGSQVCYIRHCFRVIDNEERMLIFPRNLIISCFFFSSPRGCFSQFGFFCTFQVARFSLLCPPLIGVQVCSLNGMYASNARFALCEGEKQLLHVVFCHPVPGYCDALLFGTLLKGKYHL